MSKRAVSPSQFEKLLDALSTDLIRSIHYRELFLSVRSQIQTCPDVFAQSNTFWWLTFSALSDASLHCLCRVFDHHPQALSLPNLLHLISRNPNYFSIENFKERLRDNPFVDSLAKYPRTLSRAELDRDSLLVSKKDPLVDKLTQWRHNLYAHRSASSTLEDFRDMASVELGWEEVKELSDRAFNIYNRYQSLFKANTYSSQLVGADDFQNLLRIANSGLEAHRKNLANEIAPHICKDPPAHA
ncbi:MAG TPA: hypothetical protein VFT46_00550 [Holophagaceae bacterium]|nr:hypothetical protein [Holophagaceae bacterium]